MKARFAVAAAGFAVALGFALGGAPALAKLEPGAVAPDFSTEATLGPNEFTFDLKEALAKGPVVLYFYPAAFTSGCTIEAHDFAAHMDDYAKLHATVIGISGDGIEKLKKFSVSECRSKFPVGSDGNHAISKSYDATFGFGPIMYSDRTSYVIAPDGKVVFSYHALDPGGHVAKTLDALRKLQAASPAPAANASP